MDEDIGGIENVIPMRDSLQIDEIHHRSAQNAIQHVRRATADDEAKEKELDPFRRLALEEKNGACHQNRTGKQGKDHAMPWKRAKSAPDVTYVRDKQEGIDYMCLPDRQIGVHQIAADLGNDQY